MHTATRRPITLLLIDDDPAMVRLLATLVGRAFGVELEVHSLTNPSDALTYIDEHIVDIIVTDLEMPGPSGVELLKAAKRRSALTQVLFVTGHSSLEALTAALESGATDYLLKPLDQEQLITLIGEARDRLTRWRRALASTLATHRCQTGNHA